MPTCQRSVDTTDEWITTRTGIKERRMAAKDEAPATWRRGGTETAWSRRRSSRRGHRFDPRRHRDARTCSSRRLRALCRRNGAKNAACSIFPRPARDFFSRSRSRSNSSLRTPTKPCWSSARRSSLRSQTGPIATPVCCLATARAQRSCSIAAAAARCYQHSYRQRRTIYRHPVHARRRCRSDPRENADQKLNTIHMAGKEVFKQAVISCSSRP